MRKRLVLLSIGVVVSAHAADIGGWMEHKSREQARQRDDAHVR
jgi:hypothetical protein